MKNIRINILAAAVIALGGLSLAGAQPAEAADLGPCDDFRTARMAALMECAESGGTAFQSSGSCGSEGYTLNTTCYY